MSGPGHKTDFAKHVNITALVPEQLLAWMFEDSINREENLIALALGEVSFDASTAPEFIRGAIEDYLSKDSDTIRYNYSRLNGMVPEKTSTFSWDYPKKSTNLDTDFHHYNFDVDILTRWISRDVLRMFVPVIYFQDCRKERMEKRAAALTAKPVPTLAELNVCAQLRGKGFWNRKGEWFCTTRDISQQCDQHGPKSFSTYNEWARWDAKLDDKIREARWSGDSDTLRELRLARNSA